MATQMEERSGPHGAEAPGARSSYSDVNLPLSPHPRHRRRHDRTKYPWRYQRLRRKLIHITVASSIALLFLFGSLYLMIAANREPSGAPGSSSTLEGSRRSASLPASGGRRTTS